MGPLPQTPTKCWLQAAFPFARISQEQIRYRASGLTLVTSAIAVWTAVFMDRAVLASARNGLVIDPGLLKYHSPPGWEHINLTGDYHWKSKRPAQGRFRPLRTSNHPERALLSVFWWDANRNSNRYETTLHRKLARQLNDNRKTNNR
jgi:hypothetical protein